MLDLRPGDLIGFAGRGLLCSAINLGTCGWPFPWPARWRGISHVAICAELPGVGMAICESLAWPPPGDLPCAVQGKRTAGVQAHYPIPRLVCEMEAGGQVWHYRLAEPLRFTARLRLSDFAAASIGTPYDWQGAFDARDLAISAAKRWWLGDNGLHELFCSELVAACWKRAGRGLWANPSHWAPNQLCRAALRDRLCLAPRRIQEADL